MYYICINDHHLYRCYAEVMHSTSVRAGYHKLKILYVRENVRLNGGRIKYYGLASDSITYKGKH